MFPRYVAILMVVTLTLLMSCTTSDSSVVDVNPPALVTIEPPATLAHDKAYEPNATTTPITIHLTAVRTATDPPTQIAPPPTETPRATAIPTVPSLSIKPTVCTEAPSVYDLRTLLGMDIVIDVAFLDENTLQISGWRPRSQFGNPSGPDTPSWIFNRTVIDLLSGEMTQIDVPLEKILFVPCPNCGGTQILDESPDGAWQLLTTTNGNDEEVGVWLVNIDGATRLADYIPSSLDWEWANDSSFLWLTHSTYDSPGRDFLIVELGPSVNITRPGPSNITLDASLYNLAISPNRKQILTARDYDNFTDPVDDHFYLYDASVLPPNLIFEGESVNGLEAVVWDEALDSFLLVIAGEATIEFQTTDRAVVMQVQPSAITPAFPHVTDKSLSYYTGGHIDYALSANGQRLAIGYGSLTGLVVINCVAYE